jgi:formylglycine-generating enzyme required for sulfatase activity
LLEGEIDKKLSDAGTETARCGLAKRQATAAVGLLRLGRPGRAWPLLQHSEDPVVRSYLIHRLGPLGVPASSISGRLAEERDVTVQRALVLSLGAFEAQALQPDEQKLIITQLQNLYQTASDPGLHAAAEWVLRKWDRDRWLKEMDNNWARDGQKRQRRLAIIRAQLAKVKQPQWYVNGQGMTMVVIPGPNEFVMGSPVTEENRLGGEVQHRRRIERTFAIAATPVTQAQFVRYSEGALPPEEDRDKPETARSWNKVALYCNWLSEKEGISRDQWCYETTPQGIVTAMKANYLHLTGYRLPTEAEVEFATRAGSVTRHSFGDSEELLAQYGWYALNSQTRLMPVARLKPNDFGLFDMHGNVWCWCQNVYDSHPSGAAGQVFEDQEEKNLTVNPEKDLVIRGGCYKDKKDGPNLALGAQRSAGRWPGIQWSSNELIGFRVARTIVVKEK